jgi:hypothetical protein
VVALIWILGGALAAAPPVDTYRLHTTPCPEAGLEAAPLTKALALELLPRRLTESATVAAVELSVRAQPCRAYEAHFILGHGDHLEDLGQLDDLHQGRRATGLALLIAERLSRGAVRPRPVVAEPEIPTPAPKTSAQLSAAAVIHGSQAGVGIFGLRLGAAIFPWGPRAPIHLELGAGRGRSSDPLGAIDTTTFLLRLGPDLAWGVVYVVALGPRLELGWVGIRGDAEGNNFAGYGGGLYGVFGGELRFQWAVTPRLGLLLRAELGATFRGWVAEADGRVQGGLEGWVGGGGVGLTFR